MPRLALDDVRASYSSTGGAVVARGPGSVRPGTASGGRAAAAGAAATFPGDDGEWTRGWEGKGTMTTLTGLLPGVMYRVRVVALNADGAASAPSSVVGFTTPDAKAYLPLGKGNAHVTFTVSVGDDLVLGDTVLWTEQVLLDVDTRSKDLSYCNPAGRPAAVMAVRSVAGFVTRMPPQEASGGGRPGWLSSLGGRSGRELLSLSASFTSSHRSGASTSASRAGHRDDDVLVTVIWSEVESKEEWRPLANKSAPMLKPSVVEALVYPAGAVVTRPGAMMMGGADLVRCPWYDELSRISAGVERRRAVELEVARVPVPQPVVKR